MVTKKTLPLRLRLAKTKTKEEIQQMIFDVENDPDSTIGATGSNLLGKSAMKKIDEMTWALYYLNGSAQKTVNAKHDMTRKNW